MKKVLYISGSLGLGHITRDIAIADQLRKLIPEVDIEWLAANPATITLMEAGEKIVPEVEQYANDNITAEKAAKGSSLNILKYLIKAKKDWNRNRQVFINLINSKRYDLVIGDETYEINLAMREHPELKKFPFVMIFDFCGLDAMTKNPLEHLGVYYWNHIWSRAYRLKQKPPYDLALFVGVPENVPDKSFGFMLPNRREFAKAMYTFVGYVFPFDADKHQDKQELRSKLGYGSEPLVICSNGGTAIGKEMIELCGEAFRIVKEKIPNLNFKVVAGPRLATANLHLPKDVEVVGFVPKLYEHFAACDLAVVQGGATSTLELTALRRPFIYFPIEGHCEQANVSRILSQHGAGLRLTLSKTTPKSLAEKMTDILGKEVLYPDIPKDGAQKAARHIVNLLERF
jgi:predicted glycosyltransferase